MSKIAFLLLSPAIYLISLLPLRIHYSFCSVLLFFLSRVAGYRRSVVTVNIARSFPEFKYDKVEKTVKKFYKNLSQIVAENIWVISASGKSVNMMVTLENPDVLSEIYSNGDSVILVGGHTGNWELITRLEYFKTEQIIGFTRKNTVIAYKRQHSNLSDRIIKWVRNSHKTIKLVESQSLGRFVLKNRHKQYCYILYADQAPLPGSKFVVDFLSRETTMINGPEMLARAIDCPVVYFRMQRSSRGRYKIVFSKITGKPSETKQGFITGQYAALLEESIKDEPDNWLWSHKRWKRGVEENSIRV